MLPLNDTLWSKLNPAAHAPSYPTQLRELAATIAAGDYARESLGILVTMCDQWSTFDATLAAVPHLVELCRRQSPNAGARLDLLAWVGWCAACICLNRQDGLQQLKHWYNESVPVARDLIAESLPFAQDSDGEKSPVRELLAAFAACHGKPALAFILYELESGGFRCDRCHSFIRPMESSMNPMWEPK